MLDVPQPNTDGLALIARRATTQVFATARMYTGPAPAIARINALHTEMWHVLPIAWMNSAVRGGSQREPLPAESPLLSLENVVVSPHVAGWDYESIAAMAEIAARCVVDLYQRRWPDGCVVNDELRPGWHW